MMWLLADLRWLPVALAMAMWLVELPTFRPRRTEAEVRDHGSLWLFRLLVPAGTAIAFTYGFSPLAAAGRLGMWAAAVAIVIFVSGAAVRAWAIRTLGRNFTRTVQVAAEQPVIDSGPYRLVRHPSYTGGMLEFVGVGLALRNWISVAIIIVAISVTYAYRIRIEETELARALGEPYHRYMQRTKRLVPYLF
jgi:protein-S-isoprenylcysteine O-methyltransferase Ste14